MNAPEESPPPSLSKLGILGIVGPGLAMAAFGVGGGDVTASSLGGARYGLALLWVPLLAGVLKYTLNEGLARWQLATDQTLIEGWALRMGPAVKYGFLIYLLIWTISVFGTLISATGVAANLMLPLHDLIPFLEGRTLAGGPGRSAVAWSFLFVILGVALVWFGRYGLFEKIMSALVLTMFLVAVVSSILLMPSAASFASALRGPWIPAGSMTLVMATMGGLGSTVGVLAYNYWMRERGRRGAGWTKVTWIDLGACYFISALFGVCMIILAGGVEEPRIREILQMPEGASVTKLSLEQVFRLVRYRLTHETALNETGGWLLGTMFGLSLWSTVASSLLGLLQSIPYLFADFLGLLTGASPEKRVEMTSQQSKVYRIFLLVIAFAPLPLVVWKPPTSIAIFYAVLGSLFMPFLAATLLYMNNRTDWVGRLKNGWLSNLVLVICLMLFGIAGIYSAME